MIEGDEDAFKYFFDTYYDSLCNFANSYLRDEVLSEDLVQNIFVCLWEKKEFLPADCSVKSYLYTASKNRSLNCLRDLANQKRITAEVFAKSELTDKDASQFLEFEELKKIISLAIDGLPAQCQTIYRLSRDGGLSSKEIAEKLGISIKTVENQITIAIKKIKDYLQPYYGQIFIFFLLSIFF